MPDAGMFLLIDVRRTGKSGFEFMSELYRRERVSVLDGGAFGTGTAGFVRLFFATDEEPLREGCARIRRFAASLMKGAIRP
jgi:aspartate/methionine/tyrosine aminotransferase